MTKAELVQAIKAKVAKASPSVKREFYKLLRSSTKAKLERILRNVRVTSGGDIRLS